MFNYERCGRYKMSEIKKGEKGAFRITTINGSEYLMIADNFIVAINAFHHISNDIIQSVRQIYFEDIFDSERVFDE
jgi:hypothetical protein